jgi:hypothetical protein
MNASGLRGASNPRDVRCNVVVIESISNRNLGTVDKDSDHFKQRQISNKIRHSLWDRFKFSRVLKIGTRFLFTEGNHSPNCGHLSPESAILHSTGKASPTMKAIRGGSKTERIRVFANAAGSICFNCEFDSNEIDQSDSQKKSILNGESRPFRNND